MKSLKSITNSLIAIWYWWIMKFIDVCRTIQCSYNTKLSVICCFRSETANFSNRTLAINDVNRSTIPFVIWVFKCICRNKWLNICWSESNNSLITKIGKINFTNIKVACLTRIYLVLMVDLFTICRFVDFFPFITGEMERNWVFWDTFIWILLNWWRKNWDDEKMLWKKPKI